MEERVVLAFFKKKLGLTFRCLQGQVVLVSFEEQRFNRGSVSSFNITAGGSNENINEYDDSDQVSGEIEEFVHGDNVEGARVDVDVDKVDIQIEDTAPNIDSSNSKSGNSSGDSVYGSRSRKSSVYVDGFAHINDDVEANPFDHISIPQNLVALSEDPFDDDSNTLQSRSKDSIPDDECPYVPLVASCATLWGNDKKLIKIERPLTLEGLYQKIKVSYPKAGDDFSVSYRVSSDEARYVELSEANFDEFSCLSNIHINITTSKNDAASPRVTARKKTMSVLKAVSTGDLRTCEYGWIDDCPMPDIGCIAVSCNGVRLSGLDEDFQYAILRNQQRPLIIEFMKPTEAILKLLSTKRPEEEAQSPAGISLQAFVSKYNHPLAIKLRKTVDDLLRDYVECDWSEAVKSDSDATPQATIVSIYRHIEFEMQELGLFDHTKPQGIGFPAMTDAHLETIRNHIETFICKQISAFTRKIGNTLVRPKRLNTLDDADYDTPDYPLDNSSNGLSASQPSNNNKTVFETTLRMKLACLQSVTLKHLGLHVDSNMPSCTGGEVRFESEKVIEREEWRLATKGLCRAMIFDTPQMILRKLVATMHMITHAIDAYIRNPINITLSLKCSECGETHSHDLCDTSAISHIGRKISSKESEVPSKELSADDLMPGIAFTIIQSNPPAIDASIWFASEFRHPDLLYGEESYWLSQLQSAVEFCRAASAKSFDESENDFFDRINCYKKSLQLVIACKNNHISMVESILTVKDININVLTPDQRDNPLTATITYNNLDCMRLLLKHPDINVNKTLSPCHGRQQRSTPLLQAVSLGRLDMIVLLLQAGADRYLMNDAGFNALSLSLSVKSNNNTNSVVMDRIIQVLSVDPQRMSLAQCIHTLDPNILKAYLIQVKNLESVNNPVSDSEVTTPVDGFNYVCTNTYPIFEAVKSHNVALVKLLLGIGRADVNIANANGDSVLLYYIKLCRYLCISGQFQSNHITIIAILLVAGADRYKEDINGFTALQWLEANKDNKCTGPDFTRLYYLLRCDPASNLSGNMALFSKERDSESVRSLILQLGDLNQFHTTYTALIAASFNKDYVITELLLQSFQLQQEICDTLDDSLDVINESRSYYQTRHPVKLNLDIQGRQGMSALHFAAQEGDEVIAGRLLEFGASRTIMNDRYHSPLDIAIANGHLDTANTLKCDPNVICICLAAKHGDWTVLSALLRQGVSINATQKIIVGKDRHYELHCPLIAAAAFNQKELLKRIVKVKDVDINAVNKLDQTALMYAAHNGDEAIVMTLLKAGANRYLIDKRGQNACHFAEKGGHSHIGVLISSDPAKFDILKIIAEGSYDTAVALFKQGVDANHTDPVTRRTPLIVAAMNNRIDVTKLLLKAPSILINSTDGDNRSALHYAASSGHEELLTLLLVAGASRLTVDRNGMSIINAAVTNGRFSCAALIEADPLVYNIHTLCEEGNKLMVLALLKQNISPLQLDQRQGKGNATPLHAACSRPGNKDTVKILLSFLSDPTLADYPDDNGVTPLMVAARRGYLELTSLLLAHGCNRNIKDHNGLTATEYAMKHGYSTYLSFVAQQVFK